jgi:hypothetical protein
MYEGLTDNGQHSVLADISNSQFEQQSLKLMLSAIRTFPQNAAVQVGSLQALGLRAAEGDWAIGDEGERELFEGELRSDMDACLVLVLEFMAGGPNYPQEVVERIMPEVLKTLLHLFLWHGTYDKQTDAHSKARELTGRVRELICRVLRRFATSPQLSGVMDDEDDGAGRITAFLDYMMDDVSSEVPSLQRETVRAMASLLVEGGTHFLIEHRGNRNNMPELLDRDSWLDYYLNPHLGSAGSESAGLDLIRNTEQAMAAHPDDEVLQEAGDQLLEVLLAHQQRCQDEDEDDDEDDDDSDDDDDDEEQGEEEQDDDEASGDVDATEGLPMASMAISPRASPSKKPRTDPNALAGSGTKRARDEQATSEGGGEGGGEGKQEEDDEVMDEDE